MKTKFILGLAVTMILLGCAFLPPSGGISNSGTDQNNIIDPANMDLSVSPGEDFYRYANGGWLDANPAPEAFGRFGAFTELYLANSEKVQSIVTDPSLMDAPIGSNQRKIAEFYAAGMDSLQLEAQGITPLQPLLEQIRSLGNREELLELLPELHILQTDVFFNMYPDQDEKDAERIIAQLRQSGLGMPDRDDYLAEDDRAANLRKAYRRYMLTGFNYLDRDTEAAAAAATKIMALETRLAEISMTRLERRDLKKTYNPTDRQGLAEICPSIDWDHYFSSVEAEVGRVNIRQPDFYRGLSRILAETPLEDLKLYLEWHLVMNFAGVMNQDWRQASFEFFGTALNGTTQMQPRWRVVLRNVDRALGEAVGEEYVARYFPPESKERMLTLVHNLQKSMARHIQNLDWMSPTTKEQALHKLETMNIKIGYPDVWTDFSSLEIQPGQFAANVMAGRKFHFLKDMHTIGKPVDRTIWFMNPQTVNAYYSPSLNEIVFPAGILAPPFFWADGDDAVNYGGIGMVIAHEITHGFDDQGSQFDASGNMENWWTPEDSIRFSGTVSALADQYDDYVVLDSVHVNGHLTLGENIADVGGLAIAYDALQMALAGKERKKIAGFTPEQRFFLSFAQIWRVNYKPEALVSQIKLDPHSPAMFRVEGALVNLGAFQETFGVGPTEAMYREEGQRLTIW